MGDGTVPVNTEIGLEPTLTFLFCKRCSLYVEDCAVMPRKPFWCRQCQREYNNAKGSEYRKTPLGKARAAWHHLNDRAGNRDGRNPTYASVKVLVTRPAFLEWYCRNYFPGCSVDRINDSGHYELGNLQMLTLSENSRKRPYCKNLRAPEGTAWCSHCTQYKDRSEFFHANYTPSGVSWLCKPCDRARRRR